MTKDDKGRPTETPGGADRPRPKDSDEARQMALAEEIMDEDREVLRALAKWVPFLLSAEG